MKKTPHETPAPAALSKEAILLAIDAETGIYLLSLITQNLRFSARRATPEQLESRTGFALYLRDSLPPSQISVPAFTGHPGPDRREALAEERTGDRRGSAAHASKPGRSEAA